MCNHGFLNLMCCRVSLPLTTELALRPSRLHAFHFPLQRACVAFATAACFQGAPHFVWSADVHTSAQSALYLLICQSWMCRQAVWQPASHPQQCLARKGRGLRDRGVLLCRDRWIHWKRAQPLYSCSNCLWSPLALPLALGRAPNFTTIGVPRSTTRPWKMT